ncbi:hypothetical protein BC826DRAFT_971785 [Russula brevipes]|nr:hypothetical protein BC826DRAFT_971785 [Russula brevipes]
MTERTTTHEYPHEEIRAIMDFYGGMTCVLTRNRQTVQWAHLLDAAFLTSDQRVQHTSYLQPSRMLTLQMLDRHLRQDKHPRHAAEIRENVIPLNPTHHCEMDNNPPIATLFLHEDLVARTLAFELDLKQWRLAEIEAGRGDPGRPNYLDAFSLPFTEHRWHSRGSAVVNCDEEKIYYARDCPGVYPPSDNAFPTVRTLLSIPFSLLHTVPRLSAIVPRSQYQHELIAMGEEILFLWSWDPSPVEVELLSIRAAQNNSRTVRTPQPIPIRDRQNVTFDAMRSHVSFGPATGAHRADHSARSVPDGATFKLASGQVAVSVIPHLSRRRGAGLQLSDGDGEQLDMNYKETDLTHETIATFLEGFSETISVSSSESREWQDPEKTCDQYDQCWSPSDIIDWSNMIIDENEKTLSEVPPLIITPFEKGTIGGLSTNDLLMIKGLIDPGLYVQYMHLELFSQQ